jgi:hypothetical protein
MPCAGAIGEVKNVTELGYTDQLKDFAAYAREKGYVFELWIRAGDGTKLTAELRQMEACGQIVVRRALK